MHHSNSKKRHLLPGDLAKSKTSFKGSFDKLRNLAVLFYITSILHLDINSIIQYLALLKGICYSVFTAKKNTSLNINSLTVHLKGATDTMPGTEPSDLSLQEAEQITISQAEKYLMQPYPVWLLSPQGIVIGANLLASWLWEAPQLSNLFDLNVFEIFYRNRQRIPEHENEEFFRKKIPVLKRLIGGFGEEPYRSFLEYVKRDPDLKEIYDQVQYIPNKKWTSQRVWEYPLRIQSPIVTGKTELLKFQVVVFRLSPGNEFLAIYVPHSSSKITQSIVGQKYREMAAVLDVIGYVQNKTGADKYRENEQEGGELVISKEQNSQEMQDVKKEVEHFGLDQSMLERALAILAQAREQQLETLAQRRDFPQFVINELQEKLHVAKRERMEWEEVNGRTAEAERRRS